MKLSDGEKLILVMLTDLYEKLGIDSGIDAKLVRAAVYSGNEWGLKQGLPGVFSDRTIDPSLVTEVGNILQMWWGLEEAYARLTPEEKKRVDKAIDPFSVQFDGFDGNNESEHLSIAHFVINQLNQFGHFKGRAMNSHSPSLAPSRRMLSAYDSMLQQNDGRRMNGDDIIAVVNARRCQ